MPGFNPCFNGSMYKNIPLRNIGIEIISSFNPCFNGSMYKNRKTPLMGYTRCRVSILVLMDLCIKTLFVYWTAFVKIAVSILVLMDLCIKTQFLDECGIAMRFVSILVLMDLCIKTDTLGNPYAETRSFNPCFNGSMYKNLVSHFAMHRIYAVSILVLMDLCIKTLRNIGMDIREHMFQSLF